VGRINRFSNLASNKIRQFYNDGRKTAQNLFVFRKLGAFSVVRENPREARKALIMPSDFYPKSRAERSGFFRKAKF
jgi:hypothetical protein